ncbi:MAG: flagellin [Lachnospiraceae bacterium]|nr:flagellin [Lachnospiraceae bacterium]
MIVQHNMSAMNTNRQLGITNSNLSKSTEKLSSGYRINRAGDDAAGLTISEKMRGQIRGLEQGSTNAQDGISLIQTAEGALNEVHSILQRMRELAVQGSNDTNVTADREAIYQELSQMTLEINRIGCTTEFNTMKLFASTEQIEGTEFVGTMDNPDNSPEVDRYSRGIAATTTEDAGDGGYHFDNAEDKASKVVSLGALEDGTYAHLQVGANSTQSILFRMNTLDVTKLNFAGAVDGDGDTVDISSASGTLSAVRAALDSQSDEGVYTEEVYKSFTAAITDYDQAITNISKSRSYLGAIQNRLEHTIANADNTAENLQASESRIRDVNMADQMVTYSKDSILQQAGQSMLAQANQSTQGVLSLLR